MIDSINRIELNPEQMESFSGGHALGIYRPGFHHKKESLRFFRACVGDEMYEKAMSSAGDLQTGLSPQTRIAPLLQGLCGR